MAGITPRSLSKSRFIAGKQCTKRLWLEIHQSELKDELKPSQLAIFAQGTEVGELVRKLFPEGVLIAEGPLQKQEALESTRLAVEGGARVLFEAAAEGLGGFARADIIVKVDDCQWDIIECKSGGGLEDEIKEEDEIDCYLNDMSHQRCVFEAAGYHIRHSKLALLNKDYIRAGELDLERLFLIEDHTAEVVKRMPEVRSLMEELQVVAQAPAAPEKLIGTQCEDPYSCPFIGHCFKDVPDYSVFDLRGMRRTKSFPMYHSGIQTPEQIVNVDDLTDFQQLQLSVKKLGQVHVDMEQLRSFLSGIEYPIYFMDFETCNTAIPLWTDTHPFQVLPFQYSVHVQRSEGGEVEHYEYLPDHANDPREELLIRLLGDIGAEGAILAYNSAFEKTVLKKLALTYLRYADQIKVVVARLKDLAEPFRKGWILSPKQKGKYSLKKVLPTFVQGMSYEGMVIGEGGAASQGYLDMLRQDESQSGQERQEGIRSALLEYCQQDTLGMVKILEYLRGLI